MIFEQSFGQGESLYYDIFHQDKDYKSEAKEIKKKFPKTKTILEIGCGTGNLTKELEKLGFEITCIEPSKEMLKYFKGKKSKIIQTTIQDYQFPPQMFDLAIATYDALNYVLHKEWFEVYEKINSVAKDVYFEVWNRHKPVYPFTYKKADGCHRIRLGFRFRDIAYLWYIFWGKGLVISHHKLYL